MGSESRLDEEERETRVAGRMMMRRRMRSRSPAMIDAKVRRGSEKRV